MLAGFSHVITLPEKSGSQFRGARIPLLTFINLGAFCDSPLLLSLLGNWKEYCVLGELLLHANLKDDIKPDSEVLKACFELKTSSTITGETKKKKLYVALPSIAQTLLEHTQASHWRKCSSE